MINLPASSLSVKWTKEELRNARIMEPYIKYKKCLEEAHIAKADLLDIRASIKKGQLDEKNLKAAIELEAIFKADAIKHWNKSQEYLAKHNELNK